MIFHTEMLFSFKASMTILATLLGEKLVHLWSQGERWLSKKTEVFLPTNNAFLPSRSPGSDDSGARALDPLSSRHSLPVEVWGF